MVYCAALNCLNATSGACKNSSVSFHGFPLHNQPLLKQWLQNMGRHMETPSKYQRLCSDHFEESSFERDLLKICKNRCLLKDAVPNKFIQGKDGKWLVGTPQIICSGMMKTPRKRIQNPEHQRVPGAFAQQPRLEDWQNEFYKQLLKEKCGSLISLGKGFAVPKSNIPAGGAAWVTDQQGLEGRRIPASLSTGCGGAVITSQLQSAGGTQVHGTFLGASQDLNCHSSPAGEPSGSHHHPAANPGGIQRGTSFPAEGQVDEFKEFLLYHQSRPEEAKVPWFICTVCGKSFARHAYLVRHQRTHTGPRPHACSHCGKRFLEKPTLIRHLKTHFEIIHVPEVVLD